jgi:hypothetical protein
MLQARPWLLMLKQSPLRGNSQNDGKRTARHGYDVLERILLLVLASLKNQTAFTILDNIVTIGQFWT